MPRNVEAKSVESDADVTFAAIESQTTMNDRRSLIAVRNSVRRAVGEYTYLEIGSHLGGSLQPFVLDPSCKLMWSIDKRPAVMPDARGSRFEYADNSTARMVALLTALDPAIGDRLRWIDSDAADIPASTINPAPKLMFVDGEHTDRAVYSDGEFCRRVMDPAGSVLVFHDAQIVYLGLRQLFLDWEAAGVPFTAYHLPDVLMVVEFGLAIHDDAEIRPLLLNNHVGYLTSLFVNDVYRHVANRFPAKQYWALRKTAKRWLRR
ncbi:MAG: class I SAM-dependent methyltransferase [Actinomycetia bacterium]|nr:class I SAM-dependent methyltransferase [Actinomycetes bacterium]